MHPITSSLDAIERIEILRFHNLVLNRVQLIDTNGFTTWAYELIQKHTTYLK